MRPDSLHARGEENPGTRYTSRTSSGSTPSDVQKEAERGRPPARPFRCRHRRARAVKVISCTTTGRRKDAACECATQRHRGRCARINVPRRRAEMSQNGRVERGRRGPKDDFLRKQRQKCGMFSRRSGRRHATARPDRLHARGEENPGTRYTSRASSWWPILGVFCALGGGHHGPPRKAQIIPRGRPWRHARGLSG